MLIALLFVIILEECLMQGWTTSGLEPSIIQPIAHHCTTELSRLHMNLVWYFINNHSQLTHFQI
jgi:hypothetical protein